MAETDPRPNPAASGGGATGRVLAVNVGIRLPLVVAGAGTEAVVLSAIRKHPLSTLHHPIAVGVHLRGLAGDEQADLTVHGGRDRAVYAYPIEHYTWWCAHRASPATSSTPSSAMPRRCATWCAAAIRACT